MSERDSKETASDELQEVPEQPSRPNPCEGGDGERQFVDLAVDGLQDERQDDIKRVDQVELVTVADLMATLKNSNASSVSQALRFQSEVRQIIEDSPIVQAVRAMQSLHQALQLPVAPVIQIAQPAVLRTFEESSWGKTFRALQHFQTAVAPAFVASISETVRTYQPAIVQLARAMQHFQQVIAPTIIRTIVESPTFQALKELHETRAELRQYLSDPAYEWVTTDLGLLIAIRTDPSFSRSRRLIAEEIIVRIAQSPRVQEFIIARLEEFGADSVAMFLEGLSGFNEGRLRMTIPGLLIHLEGIMARAACNLEIAKPHPQKGMGRLIFPSSPGGNSAEGIIKALNENGLLSPKQFLFLQLYVFGERGNAFRHGRAAAEDYNQFECAKIILAYYLVLSAIWLDSSVSLTGFIGFWGAQSQQPYIVEDTNKSPYLLF